LHVSNVRRPTTGTYNAAIQNENKRRKTSITDLKNIVTLNAKEIFLNV
jgi:hypothetical protein